MPAERYLELLKTARVKGYRFEQQNYYTKQAEGANGANGTTEKK